MKKWMRIVLIVLLLIGTIVVLAAAHNRESGVELSEPEVTISVQDGIALLTETELKKELEVNQLYYPGMLKEDLDIAGIESFLSGMNEVQSAEVYIDIGGQWHVDVKTRRPVARIMRKTAPDFYLDKNAEIMRVSTFYRPKILAFTGLEVLFEQGVSTDEIINNDTLITKYKLDQIYRISNYVCNSAFYDAQIVQVHYSIDDGFILVPRVGDQVIIFGEAPSEEIVEEKFNKLTNFYDEVIPYEGWDKYEEINLKFEGQIVAKKN